MSSRSKSQRQTFVLTCWSKSTEPRSLAIDWRYSLERIGGQGERLGFASLRELMAYVRCSLEEFENEMKGDYR